MGRSPVSPGLELAVQRVISFIRGLCGECRKPRRCREADGKQAPITARGQRERDP